MEVSSVNQEQTEAWDGVLFERFVEYRELVTTGLGHHGLAAMELHPPRSGDSAIDLGCGFGDTSLRLAELVGPDGDVLGVDVAPRFIETAQKEADEAGVDNVSFEVADVQTAKLEQRFDYAFSRMGIMFFDNPVAALRNIREALKPGGRLSAAVWRRKLDNDWVHRAEQVVDRYLEEPEETDEPTCGPGPFSMANADTLTEQLTIAGFEQISLHRCDAPIKLGDDLEHAIEFNLALGPAAEVIRLVDDDEVERVRSKIETDLREALADFVEPDGIMGPASTWIIGATAPA